MFPFKEIFSLLKRPLQRTEGYDFYIEPIREGWRMHVRDVFVSASEIVLYDSASNSRVKQRTVGGYTYNWIEFPERGCIVVSGENIMMIATEYRGLENLTEFLDLIVLRELRGGDPDEADVADPAAPLHDPLEDWFPRKIE